MTSWKKMRSSTRRRFWWLISCIETTANGSPPTVTGAAPLVDLGGWSWLPALAGAVLLLTGVVRVCPAYLPFGINTCRKP